MQKKNQPGDQNGREEDDGIRPEFNDGHTSISVHKRSTAEDGFESGFGFDLGSFKDDLGKW